MPIGRKGTKVTIEVARKLCADGVPVLIHWRPEIKLPEEEQYAIVY